MVLRCWFLCPQVVDARAGPGTKSLTKFKSKKIKKNIDSPDKPLKEKIKKKHRSVHFFSVSHLIVSCIQSGSSCAVISDTCHN